MPAGGLASAGLGLLIGGGEALWGNSEKNKYQNQINALMNQYNYQQQLPENMLSWYSGLLGNTAAPFSSSSSAGSSTINPWLTAAGAGTALYGSGVGGALVDGISSLFSSGLGEDFLAGMA